MNPVDPKLANAALNTVAVYSALTKKALDEVSTHREAQEKAASVRPDLLNLMLETGAVTEEQKEAADAMLGSHAETLGLLKSALTKMAEFKTQIEKQASELGRPDDDTSLGGALGDYDSLSDGYVGRKTSQKKASDEAILSVLQPPGT